MIDDVLKSFDLLDRVIRHLRKPGLSDTQKKLLKASLPSGEFGILKCDQLTNPIIQAGGKDMGDENNPADLAKYNEEFKSLVTKGLAERVTDNFYRLTAEGFKIAQAL